MPSKVVTQSTVGRAVAAHRHDRPEERAAAGTLAACDGCAHVGGQLRVDVATNASTAWSSTSALARVGHVVLHVGRADDDRLPRLDGVADREAAARPRGGAAVAR